MNYVERILNESSWSETDICNAIRGACDGDMGKLMSCMSSCCSKQVLKKIYKNLSGEDIEDSQEPENELKEDE